MQLCGFCFSAAIGLRSVYRVAGCTDVAESPRRLRGYVPADTADLKCVGPQGLWGFKSHEIVVSFATVVTFRMWRSKKNVWLSMTEPALLLKNNCPGGRLAAGTVARAGIYCCTVKFAVVLAVTEPEVPVKVSV